jgi:hypothetical protein
MNVFFLFHTSPTPSVSRVFIIIRIVLGVAIGQDLDNGMKDSARDKIQV